MIGSRGEVRAFGNLSDIRGRPVIDRGVVLAMGTAGQLAAVELNSGQRLWERGIGGNTDAVGGRPLRLRHHRRRRRRRHQPRQRQDRSG